MGTGSRPSWGVAGARGGPSHSGVAPGNAGMAAGAEAIPAPRRPAELAVGAAESSQPQGHGARIAAAAASPAASAAAEWWACCAWES